MAATPILAQGTTLSIDNSGGTPVTINGVTNIAGIGSGTATEIDVTTFASTAKEFLMGLQDNGSFTVDVVRNEDDSGQAECISAKAAQAQRTVIVTLPSSTNNVITMECFVLAFTTDIPKDGVATGTITFRITGAIAYS